MHFNKNFETLNSRNALKARSKPWAIELEFKKGCTFNSIFTNIYPMAHAYIIECTYKFLYAI